MLQNVTRWTLKTDGNWKNRRPSGISQRATDISRASSDASRALIGISRRSSDATRAATGSKTRLTDISHASSGTTPAPTDASPTSTFAGARPICWGFAMKWVFPRRSGSPWRPAFQKIDAIPATGQKKAVKPRTTPTPRTDRRTGQGAFEFSAADETQIFDTNFTNWHGFKAHRAGIFVTSPNTNRRSSVRSDIIGNADGICRPAGADVPRPLNGRRWRQAG